MEEEEGLTYIVACCTCHQVRDPSTKEYIPESQFPNYNSFYESKNISHSFCDPCLRAYVKKYDLVDPRDENEPGKRRNERE